MTITATAGPGEEWKGLGAGLVATSQEIGQAWGLGIVAAIIAIYANTVSDQGDLEAPVAAPLWGSSPVWLSSS